MEWMPDERLYWTAWVPVPTRNTANPARHGHWKVVAGQKKGYITTAVQILHAQPHWATKVDEPLDYYAHLFVPGARDPDNLVAQLKWPIDALRVAGWIRDDTRKCWRPAAYPGQSVIGVPRRMLSEDLPAFTRRRWEAAESWRVWFVAWPSGP